MSQYELSDDLLYAEVEEDDTASLSSLGTTDSFLIQYRSGARNGASKASREEGWSKLRYTDQAA
jgi:hypothetical protein